MSSFNMIRDGSGLNTFTLPFPQIGLNFTALLSQGTAQSLTIPASYKNYMAVFSYSPGKDVWVANSDSVEIPSGAFSASNSLLNPTSRIVSAGDVITLVSDEVIVSVNITLYGV